MNIRAATRRVTVSMVVFFLTVSVATRAGADEKDAVLSLSNLVTSPGRQVRLNLELPTGEDVSPPEMPVIDGLVFRYIGTGDGDGSSSVYSYSAVPLAEGDFTIGPVSVRHGGDTYISNTVVLKAEKGAGSGEGLKGGPQEGSGLPEGISLKVGIPRSSVFVNEKIPVSVSFYTDWLDVENLEISDDPSEMYIAEKYTPGETTIEERDGVKFAVLRFSKSFFLPEAGEFNFGPVMARCDVVGSKAEPLNPNLDAYNAFLGGKLRREVKIEEGPFVIKVSPLPEKGRPGDFMGAIGEFVLNANAEPLSIKSGETVTLTMALTGEGNYATVRPPKVGESEEIVAYEPTASRVDEGVVFTQLLKIRSSKLSAIPELRFSFFDPVKAKYVTLTRGPIRVKVAPVEGEEPRLPVPAAAAEKKAISPVAAAEEKTDLGEGIVYLKESPGKLRAGAPHFYRSGLFLTLVLIPLLLVPIAVAARERARLFGEGSPYAARIGAIKVAASGLSEAKALMSRGGTEEFYGRVFRMMQEYLGMRFSVPAEGITEGIVDSGIASRMESADIADKMKKVFHDSYLARYTTLDLDKNDMKRTMADVREIITYLNSRKSI